MKKIVILTLPVFFLVPSVFCQSLSLLKNEDVLKNELAKTKYDIDPNAKAVILYEEGTVNFEKSSFSYKYELIAKVLSDEAANDIAEVVITKRENTYVASISAETYNLENGAISKSILDNNKVLDDKINKDVSVSKFNIPNVKKGSIVHYTYKIYKTASQNLPEWAFQNIYPTLYSKYSLQLPSTISFSKILRSAKQFVPARRAKELETCDACEYSETSTTSGSFTAWAAKNIPAFESEPFSSSKDNFLDRVKVIITRFYTSDGAQVRLFNNWQDFSKQYLYGDDEYIGQVFNSNGFLEPTVTEITAGSTTDMAKAKAIFSYVRSHFAYTDNNDDNIKSVFKNKKGDVFGVNMLLTAMMKKAGLNCEPVVSTTKSRERLSSLYPSAYSLNYLIADFKDAGKDYFLDATEPNLPFGYLQPNCYNGYARMVNKTGGAVILSPDDIKDKTTIVINVVPTDDNHGFTIKVDQKLGVYRSIALRDHSKRDAADAAKSIIESVAGSSVVIDNASVRLKNFQDPDEQVSVHFEGKLSLDSTVSLLYLSPFLTKFYTKNPFVATQRTLPIEMDYKEDLTYILYLKMPENYAVDDYPKSLSVKLGADGAMLFANTLNYDTDQKLFSITSRFQTNTTIFQASDYKSIREMFERMLEEQNKKIVIKKL